ncbi:hypothetical protein GPJ56_003885 [Histomonas meleagridis]|uniref:uncharacterized protein n=1 Tax=Histomonas meleagridis TaxID=135588 RepID=UPI003559CEAE|nr:hypothetical protein GPJ56_003885 [Histomonas meleagridis]KAH0797572.1 hypothetical protein GO595_009675 [Histomonas meleagridis]
MSDFIDKIIDDFNAEFGLDHEEEQIEITSSKFDDNQNSSAANTIKEGTSAESKGAIETEIQNTKKQHSNTYNNSKDFVDISVEEASRIISELKEQRIKDYQEMEKLQIENARLKAKISILEHTDFKVAELSTRLEQLLQKYIEADQIRNKQSLQIKQLQQEVSSLKSRLPDAFNSS